MKQDRRIPQLTAEIRNEILYEFQNTYYLIRGKQDIFVN